MSSVEDSSTEIIRRNEQQWSTRLLRIELRDLEREQHHLRAKCDQRSLTEWEIGRIRVISREILEILSKLSSIHSCAASA